jgi:parallel beta-helix repeat protein
MKSIRAFFIFFVQRLLSLSILLFFVLVQAEILNANTTPLLWSFEIGNPGHIPISSYAISSDGSYIAVGVKSFEEQERGLYLFSKESNNWLWKFPSEQNGVTSVDISADGSYLVAYDHWHDLHLFNKNSDTPIWSFSPENYLGRVVISGDGNYIVASEGGGTLGETRKLYLFHRSSNIPLWTKTFATGGGGPISISYDGSYIVLGAIQLHLFHKSSNTPIWTFEGGGDVSISADGSYITLTGGGETPYFYLFHSSSNLPLWNFTSRASASISGDGNFIAVAGRSYTGGARGFLLLNRGSNIPQWIYETENAPDYPISISDDGKYLVGTENGKIYLFNRENNEPLWVYGSEPYWIYRREFKSALISGDGNYMVAAENNSISLFNVTFNLPSEVWVDQNFCETCLNGGHSWGYDAFSNIQDGIDVLWNGGNVHVASGTYLESSFEWGYDDYAVLIYRDNVKLIGEGRDTTIIDSDQDANRVLIWGKGSKLKGFTIKNSGNQYNGVYIYNSNNCNVSENKIINNGNGLNRSLSGDCIIKDNLIYNNHSTGIANYDSSSNVIANNIIGLNKWSGISSNSDDTFIYNNVINQNGTGIRFEYTSGNLLVNNTLVSTDLGIYSYESWINIFNSII